MSMNQVPQQHALQDLIPDYLNGHLSEDQQSAFEAAMDQDQELHNLVQFERKIQAAVAQPAEQTEQQTTAQPQFEDIAHKLVSKRWWQFDTNTWAVPTAAAFVIAAAVYLNVPTEPEDTFQVLSDPQEHLLKIVANGPAELDDLIAEYGLKVHIPYPDVNGIAVLPADVKSLQALKAQLDNDPRVSLTEISKGNGE